MTHNIRPYLTTDAPHLARIDQLTSPNPMPASQIAKMCSKQHITAIICENTEGVIVGWCLYMKSHGVIDVLRFQRHPEFDSSEIYNQLARWVTGRVTPGFPRATISAVSHDVRVVLFQLGFHVDENESSVLVYGMGVE